jgi:protein O-mannosyl-transferase
VAGALTFELSGIRSPRLYATVAACAVVVYLGALWNRFALDDVPIVVLNPLVAHASGMWRAFAAPYWPPDFGGHMYRPLVIAGFVLDHLVDGVVWYHAVNLVWHAGVAVAVAALARRWLDATGALVAGLLFAVHPVHVEAVANVVGRAELMAALFAVLTVYAALAGTAVGWSAAAFALGLLSKENAAVAPALVVWAWMVGLERPDRRRMLALVGSWVVVGAVYAAVRALVRQPFGAYMSIAPMFIGQSWLTVRLTAVAALADVARLLVFPLTLRADYSPNERTVVTSPVDLRFATGLGCVLLWGLLLVLAWKRGRKLEAFGLGWIGVALLPVANLLYPAGFYVAERTLYLPSVGLVLAAAAALVRLPRQTLRLAAVGLCLLGGVRTALRVPVWRDDNSVTLSIIDDSPDSYGGPARMAGVYLDRHEPAKALAAARIAAQMIPYDPWVYTIGAVAAFAVGDVRAADSLLTRLERFCSGACAAGYYRYEAAQAGAHGYPGTADSLLARARRLGPAAR